MKEQEIRNILQEYQTPAYVFDLDALAERLKKISSVLKQEHMDLCYAMKANPFLTGAMEPFVERFEVCSPGEFRICEREQLPMERLVISGVNKEPEDILRIVKNCQGRGIFTIESLRQMELLAECARNTGYHLNVLVRISSGNQFGVDRTLAVKIFAEQEKYPELIFQGIQYYSGTQKKNLALIEQELKSLDDFCQEVREQGHSVKELEYGPGFWVPYFQSDAEESPERLLEEFRKLVQNMRFGGKITLEMGRFLTADCGSFLTSIVDRKDTQGQIYGIVDGGIHHLNYYGQTMAMKLPHVRHISCGSPSVDAGTGSAKEQTEEKWNLCGSLCTTADVIVKQFPLTGGKVGDVLVFERVGAYSVTEGINLFLSRDLPKVLFYSQAQGARLIRDSQATDRINSGNL